MSNARSSLAVLVFATFPLLLGLGVYALLKPEPSPEDQVREAIQAVAQGARDKNLGDAVKPISRAYHDDEGLSFDNIRGVLFREFQQGQAISVVLGPINVELDPDGETAWADVDVALADGVDVSSLDFFPANADALRFEVELQKEGEDWKIISQSHEPIR